MCLVTNINSLHWKRRCLVDFKSKLNSKAQLVKVTSKNYGCVSFRRSCLLSQQGEGGSSSQMAQGKSMPVSRSLTTSSLGTKQYRDDTLSIVNCLSWPFQILFHYYKQIMFFLSKMVGLNLVLLNGPPCRSFTYFKSD